MIIYSVAPQEYILPSKNKKRILFTSEYGHHTMGKDVTRFKNGIPYYCKHYEDEDDIIFSTDPKEYL